MKAIIPLVFAAAFLFTGNAWAHNVYVFAWVDGDAIQAEGRFSKTNKVKNGRIVVFDDENGIQLLEGDTDAEGVFRFRLPEDFYAAGHGIRIQLQAGAGHQAEWKMSFDDLRSIAPGNVTTTIKTPGELMPPTTPSVPEFGAPVAEWEARVGQMLDERLAPIKQALARQEEREPDFRDVMGGLGWIAGLFGVATWLHYRKRTRHDSGS